MSDLPRAPRTLETLRALIDALDDELIQLLARRMGVVTEISSWKASHATPSRDVLREQAMMRDRRARAEELGLVPDEVESVFELVLRASCRHQAALRQAQSAPTRSWRKLR